MIDSLAEQKKEKVWMVCLIEMERFVASLGIYTIGTFENFRSTMQKLEGNEREESVDEDRMKGYYYQFVMRIR
jgi:hypothetical protein